MLHNVSPWVATVQEDIAGSPAIFEANMPGSLITIHSAGDSIWIVAQQFNLGKIAFRAAFGMGQRLTEIAIRKSRLGIILSAATALGQYKITVHVSKSAKVLHYTTIFTANKPLLIPFWPRDIVPLTENGQIENTTGKVHIQQIGSRSGQLFFSQTRPQNGTIFYFQNLSALSAYCEDIQATAAESVGGRWPEIGFKLPTSPDLPMLADKEYTISDAFVILNPDIPKDGFGLAELYLNNLSEVYRQLPKPETQYRNWIDISKKGLYELGQNKGCWMYADGHAYLNAYLCDYKTPPEIMVQLAVLSAVVEYDQWTGEKLPLVNEIKAGIPAFYDPKLKTISRWLPALRGNLDGSEEQKAPMTMDSWYLHHPLMTLSRLALNGDKAAEKLLLDSVEYAIGVAHHFDYQWPVFYKMDTLEVLKAETTPGMGGEKDVAGSYAYIMVNLYRLTKEKRYLNEAVRAAKCLEQYGLDVFYQANNTAFSAVALLRLFGETGDEFHLKLSYLCLAGIIKNVQLFEGSYGNGKHFPSFFGIYPLNDAPYKAAYEEMEVYAALNDYIKEANEMDAPILLSVKLLLSEFVKYSINRLPFYYPPMLPGEILSKEIKTGELDPKLWIPIEDLYDGWEKNGKVGQEVYGAGVGFGVVPRQYIQLDGKNMLFFTDYPIAGFRKEKNKITFRTLGAGKMPCKAGLITDAQTANLRFTVECKTNGEYFDAKAVSGHGIQLYEICSDAKVRISW